MEDLRHTESGIAYSIGGGFRSGEGRSGYGGQERRQGGRQERSPGDVLVHCTVARYPRLSKERRRAMCAAELVELNYFFWSVSDSMDI